MERKNEILLIKIISKNYLKQSFLYLSIYGTRGVKEAGAVGKWAGDITLLFSPLEICPSGVSRPAKAGSRLLLSKHLQVTPKGQTIREGGAESQGGRVS
jgi:hypothetical protein